MNKIVVTGLIVAQEMLVGLRERSNHAQRGQSLVEYALILAFIALLVIVAMKALQPAISNTFNHTANCLNAVQTAVPATPAPGTGSSCP